MGKYPSKIHRLLKLIHFISGHRGVSMRELVREFECHERTLFRDLGLLNEIGIPCVHDPESGGYVIRKGFFMPPVQLTFEEAMALSILLEHIPRDGQIPFFDTARQAIHKIRSQLSEKIKEEIAPLDGHVIVDLARSGGDDGAKDVYETVRQAIQTKRIMRCRYDAVKSAQEAAHDETFDLKPYLLWYCQRAWYVVGHRSDRNEVRMLKLNRFDFIQLTDRPYAIPDDFALREHLGHAWRMIRGDKRHRIVIRFEKGFADTASETRWHPTQKEKELHDDGGITLSFEIDGLDEIVWWVLGYGPNATVLEPKELADQVRDLAQATARRYAGS
ncbi:MAG TPA: WYL domain-containing protein [Tepidisphaeraceae bacterium]|jgi:predicted DNA-binding transcriptional regulator YafY|nr:WYL domain-containing protein [Tepidisphaeraceae bacterium]